MKAYYSEIENVMNRIEREWQKYNFDADAFPEVALRESEALDLSPLGDVSYQMKLMELPQVRFQQQRSTFSDLYFQMFHNGRFLIEILNWWGGHVNVHDHDFSAVQFQLKGDALNVEYNFESSDQQGALRFGKLKVAEAEIWKEGGRSLVYPGDKTPHSVFHIDEPTTSLLIRTNPTPRYGAQSNYFPTLAAHYYVSNDIQRKKLTALGLLSRNNEKEFRETLSTFIATQSLSETFFMLLKIAPALMQPRYVDLLQNYSEQGEQQNKLTESVITNSGIDFFKTRANETDSVIYDEKLAAFIVAATHSPNNLKKVLADLRSAKPAFNFDRSLNSFVRKLSSQDAEIAETYLETFGISALTPEVALEVV